MGFINKLLPQSWLKWLSPTSTSNKEEKQSYSKALYPIILKEGDAAYSAVKDLQEALRDEKVKNIALTGPYGSGKSSVIETLIQENESQKTNYHFLKISLATLDACKSTKKNINNENKKLDISPSSSTYNNQEQEEESENKDSKGKDTYKNLLNRKIEASILQQFIYREAQETLPNSRFKRIHHIPKNKIAIIAINVILYTMCICIAFEPNWLRIETLCSFLDFRHYWDYGIFINTVFDFLALGYIIWATYQFISMLIQFSERFRFQRLKIAGSEIEIKEDYSVFNHHLDEILYFFQCTEYNIVVLEDLDRFDTTEIFLKLRELNYLLNNSKVIKRSIRFIYAIKDDMFKDNSRTKFFDHITTVIPVMSSFNSKNILLKELEQAGHKGEIMKDDIFEIAYFINDMRLLKNIVNEYDQYQKQLQCDGYHSIDNKKLLAIITYKNYYPADFALLLKREGKLYEVFSPEKQAEFQIAVSKVLAERSKELTRQKEALQKTQQFNEQELRMVYVMVLTELLDYPTNIQINNSSNSYNIVDLYQDKNVFEQLFAMRSIRYYNRLSGWNNLSTSFKEIEDRVDKNHSFKERLDILQKGEKWIRKEEEKLAQDLFTIKTFSTQQLIELFQIDEQECYKKMELVPMLQVFIKRGLISENYEDYISPFYAGALSYPDHKLIGDIIIKESIDPLAKIIDIRAFINELPLYAFRRMSILNIQLIDYLAQHSNQKSKELEMIIELLLNNNPFYFISLYYEKGQYQNKFLTQYIQTNSQNIWNKILDETEYTNIMIEIWLRYCKLEDLQMISEWINSNFDFISKIYVKLSINKQTYLTTKAKYTKLAESSITQIVIEHNCYVANNETIPIVIKYKNAPNNIGILTKEEQTIAFDLLLPNATWGNITTYYKAIEQTIDTALLRFTEAKHIELGNLVYDGDLEMRHPLFLSLMNNNELSLDAYKSISQAFQSEKYIPTEDNISLQSERIEWLITNDFIEYNQTNAQNIENYFATRVIMTYIMHYKSKFTKNWPISIDYSDLACMLLTSSNFTLTKKIVIIQHINEDIQMTNELAIAIGLVYLQRNFAINEKLLKNVIAKIKGTMLSVQVVTKAIQKNKKREYITELLQKLSEPYSKMIIGSTKHPNIPYTPENEILINTLEEYQYISSKNEDAKDKGYFKVHPKKK